MKTKLLSLIALVFLAGTSCEEKIDIEKEKEAIKAVIEEETDAFWARDFDRLAATFVKNETNTRLAASKGGYVYNVGWEDLISLYKGYFEDESLPWGRKEVKTNYKIKVYKESAWAVFDNEEYNSDGELTGKGIHVEFLEKVDGKWKIAYLSIVSTSAYQEVEDNLKISTLYHELKPENVDKILTEDFIGRHYQNTFTWNRENHREFLNSYPEMQDTIYSQIGEGDWVATRFNRTGIYGGKNVNIDGMHFKRFQNGKIAEIWEYADSKQWE